MKRNAPIPPAPYAAEAGFDGSAPASQQPLGNIGARHSLHHCYIWLGTLRAAPIIYVCGLSSLEGLITLAEFLGFASVYAIIAAFFLLLAITLMICAVVTGFRAWAYRYIWYEFDETEFSFYSGILNKHRTHVPYAKVQSVNERASLLQRLAGVCTVTIDTAGGASNKAVVISYVERSAAEYVRLELFRRKRAEVEGEAAGAACQPSQPEGNVLDAAASVMDDMRGVFAKEEVDTGTVSCEYGLGNKQLVLAALCSRSSFALAVLAVVSAFATVLCFAIDLNLMSSGSVSAVAGMAKSDFLMACVAVGLMVVGCLLLAWVVHMVSACLSYGGFRARRRGNRIEVERGIVTHLFSGIDVDRIQSVHVHQTFFQRLLRCCSVSYGKVGAEGNEESGSASQPETEKLVVHPFLPLAEAWQLVGNLTPEYAHAARADTRPPKVALRRAITRRVVVKGFGFWFAVCLGMLYMAACVAYSGGFVTSVELGNLVVAAFVPGISLCIAFALVEAVGAVLWFRRSAFGFDESGTTVVNGGYSTDTEVVPRRKMQYACIRTNPLQRHAGVATVVVRTAAGVHGRSERLVDVPITDASVWLDWAQPADSSAV